jgi:hypothetical protein
MVSGGVDDDTAVVAVAAAAVAGTPFYRYFSYGSID